jgi:hypothetical protein
VLITGAPVISGERSFVGEFLPDFHIIEFCCAAIYNLNKSKIKVGKMMK